MFGSSKKTVSSVGEIETIIGKNTMIKGSIIGKGAIRIDGQFEGDINTVGNIMVGDNAKITAEVKALNATIAGTIKGNIEVSEKLELLSTAKIYGDINAGTLIINGGTIFRGVCETQQGIEQTEAKKGVPLLESEVMELDKKKLTFNT